MSEYTQGLLILVGINMIAVLGVSVLTGFTRIFSFGNAGFMAIGAYVSAIMTRRLGIPFILALAAGSLVSAVLSYIIGRITLQLKGDYFLITTLGLGEVIRVSIEFFDKITGGARGFSGIARLTTLPVVMASVVVAFIVAWNFLHSKYGRNLMAIREQEIAANSVGIDTSKYKRMSFCLSAVFAGWAGGLLAHHMMFITPMMFNLEKSSELTITVVIGGMGSLTGSLIATTIVTLLPEVFRAMSNYRMLFYGITVVLIITLRPQGIMGYSEFSIKKTIFFFTNLVKMPKRKRGL